MRVLQLHARYRLAGGEDAVVAREAALLREAGHHVEQVLLENPTGLASSIRMLAQAPWNRASAALVARAVDNLSPDVVHVHNTWFALSPSVVHAAHSAGAPLVMTVHNYRMACANAQLLRDGAVCTDCLEGAAWPAVRHRCYRGSASQTALAVATVEAARRRSTWDLVARFVAPSHAVKGVLVNSGIEGDRIAVLPHPVPAARDRSQPPSHSHTLVCAGRLAPEKGIASLLEAWRRLGEGRGQLRLVIAGEGPARPALEASAPPGVSFAGRLDPDALQTLLLTARALVFPSIWLEPFGLTVAEALGAGTPVLCSDLGAPPELVAGTGAGWTASAGDVEAWVDALLALQSDERVDAAGAAARRTHAERLDPRGGVARLEAVYSEALRRG